MKKLAAGILIFCFLANAFSGFSGHFGKDQYDDAYITYRYAAHWAQGKGPVFNEGERHNAASSFLFMGVLAGAYKLGLHDLELVSAILGLASGCLALAAAFGLGARLSGRTWLAFFCTLPLALGGAFPLWALSGMETLFFAALISLFLYGYLGAAFGPGLNFALLGAALICRPEAWSLAGPLLLWEYMRFAREGKGGRLKLAAFLAFLPPLLLFLLQKAYYGSWVPASYSFKTLALYYIWRPSSVLRMWNWLLDYYAPYLILLGAGAAYLAMKKDAGDQAGSALRFLAAYLAAAAGMLALGPQSDLQRYSVFMLPGLATAACLVLARISAEPGIKPAVEKLVLALVMGLLLEGAWDNRMLSAGFAGYSKHQEQRSKLGHWLAENTGPGELIASSDIGALAYFALDRPFLDMLGLCTPPMLDLVRNNPQGIPGAFKERRPAYFADSESFQGKLSAEEVLKHPGHFFRVKAGDTKEDWEKIYEKKLMLRLKGPAFNVAAYQILWKQALPRN